MSASSPPDFDSREQAARIDRALAQAENLRQETQKFVAEQRKLMAEAAKFDRDRGIAPWLAGGVLTATTLLLRVLGVL